MSLACISNFSLFLATTTSYILLPKCKDIILKEECPNENVTFWLYTRDLEEPYQFWEQDIDSITHAPFMYERPVKFVAHGFSGCKTSSSIEIIRDEYLEFDYNVILLDYGPAAACPCYAESVQNSRVVATCVAKFIELLLEHTEVVLQDIHFIGFSLGAQVLGLTGTILSDMGITVKRITGLDPAAPLFYFFSSCIRKESAEFVDVIHTSICGKMTAVGHIDFYVNSGIFQAGCKIWDIAGHHFRAVDYFAESITTEVGFYGHELLNSEGESVLMGEYTPAKNYGSKSIFHVRTNPESPYACGMQC